MVETILTNELIGQIVTVVLGLIAGTGYFVRIKAKLTTITNLFNTVSDALEDNKITAEETQRIMVILKAFKP